MHKNTGNRHAAKEELNKTVVVSLRFSEQELLRIDEIKGDVTRSEYIRNAVKGVSYAQEYHVTGQ